MFTKYVKIEREVIDGQDVIAWRHYVEDVNTDAIVALVTPSGLMYLKGHSTIPVEQATGVMLDLARWNRRNPEI